jgi:calcium-dependent protein kinase
MRRNYTKACDVWSAGVILYILLCGYPPFNGNTDIEIKNKVSLGVFSFPDKEWKLVSSEAKDLITRMLEMDEYDRISAEDALNHPWFVAHE